MNFPHFEYALTITEGIQNLSHRAKNFLKLGILFKISKDSEKFFILASMFHRFLKKQLEDTISYVENFKFTTDEVKYELTRRLKWLL